MRSQSLKNSPIYNRCPVQGGVDLRLDVDGDKPPARESSIYGGIGNFFFNKTSSLYKPVRENYNTYAALTQHTRSALASLTLDDNRTRRSTALRSDTTALGASLVTLYRKIAFTRVLQNGLAKHSDIL